MDFFDYLVWNRVKDNMKIFVMLQSQHQATTMPKLSYAQYIIIWGKAKLCILQLTLVFHHLPSVGPKQLCALAHLGCTHEASTS